MRRCCRSTAAVPQRVLSKEPRGVIVSQRGTSQNPLNSVLLAHTIVFMPDCTKARCQHAFSFVPFIMVRNCKFQVWAISFERLALWVAKPGDHQPGCQSRRIPLLQGILEILSRNVSSRSRSRKRRREGDLTFIFSYPFLPFRCTMLSQVSMFTHGVCLYFGALSPDSLWCAMPCPVASVAKPKGPVYMMRKY